MSHVTTIKLTILDLDALALAAKACGLELVKGQTSYKWFGRHVGDYPLPEGMTKADLGKCAHALRVVGKPGAYEIGVVAKKDGKGFELLWDFYAGGFGLAEKVGAEAVTLRNQYAAQVAIKEMRRKGYMASIQTTAKGLKVVCRK